MRGTIRPRGRGRWQVQVYAGVDPLTGKERRRAATVRGTKKEAEQRLRELITEVEAVATPTGQDLTFGQLLDRWIAHRAPSWSPKYLLEVQGLVDRHVRPTFGDVLVRRIRTIDLDRHYGQLLASGLGAPTVDAVHRRMSAAFTQAVRWELIARNPATGAAPPEVHTEVGDPPPAEDLRRLLAALDEEPQLAAYVRISANTGHRRGEVCALRWEDLDLEQRVITFRRALAKGPDGWVLKPTKTRRITVLAIGPSTTEAIERWRHVLVAEQLKAGAPMEWVFPAARDLRQPVVPEVMGRRWRRLRTQHGLDHVRLHDLRHWMATTAVAGGEDLRTVAGRGGWADPNVPLRTYAHFVPASDRALADRLDDLLDGKVS